SVDRGDVARAQPPGVELLLTRVVVEVPRRNPRSANLDLARRLAVPGDLCIPVANQAQLHPRQRSALLGAVIPVRVVVLALFGAREGRDRTRLGHAPGLEDVNVLTPGQHLL